MCLAIPALVTEVKAMQATVAVGGVTCQVSVMLLPDVKTGDYVLVHAGFAIQQVDREAAAEMEQLFREIEV